MNGSKLILNSVGWFSLSNSSLVGADDNKDATKGLKVILPLIIAVLIFCIILGKPQFCLFLN